MYAPIETVEEFYAHALAIEREAAERYLQFAEHFAAREQFALEGLCRNLADEERRHFEGLAQACAHLDLPDIAAENYRWIEGRSPEAISSEMLLRIATPRQLMELALAAEWRAHEFFARVARTSPLREVKELSSVMAAEETAHVQWVRQALEYGFSDEAAPTRY